MKKDNKINKQNKFMKVAIKKTKRLFLDLPAGDIISEDEPYIEFTDFSDIISKRI